MLFRPTMKRQFAACLLCFPLLAQAAGNASVALGVTAWVMGPAFTQPVIERYVLQPTSGIYYRTFDY